LALILSFRQRAELKGQKALGQTTMGIRMTRARQCKPCKRSRPPELESSSTKLVRIADMKEAASVGGLFFLQRRKKNDGYRRTGISPVMNRAKEGAAFKTTPIERLW
jgi:hypothetical protein